MRARALMNAKANHGKHAYHLKESARGPALLVMGLSIGYEGKHQYNNVVASS